MGIVFTGEYAELAKVGYDAYGQTTDHKNYQGLPMPQWDGLTEKIQNAWIANAKAICDRLGVRHADPDEVVAFPDPITNLDEG